MTRPTFIPTFFAAGIRFKCVHCGICCTGDPGIVGILPHEIESLAAFLGISVATCSQRYLTSQDEGYRVQERANGECIFFDDGCTIHPVRPNQCRTYPFWHKNMRSQDAWQQTCHDCPGIGVGRLFPETEILEILHSSPI